jgi:hypothetical protein
MFEDHQTVHWLYWICGAFAGSVVSELIHYIKGWRND